MNNELNNTPAILGTSAQLNEILAMVHTAHRQFETLLSAQDKVNQLAIEKVELLTKIQFNELWHSISLLNEQVEKLHAMMEEYKIEALENQRMLK